MNRGVEILIVLIEVFEIVILLLQNIFITDTVFLSNTIIVGNALYKLFLSNLCDSFWLSEFSVKLDRLNFHD